MTAPSVDTRIEALSASLEKHRVALARGEAVDLGDLEHQISDLCLDLFNMRPESRRFGPVLQALVAQLDELAAELARQRGASSRQAG